MNTIEDIFTRIVVKNKKLESIRQSCFEIAKECLKVDPNIQHSELEPYLRAFSERENLDTDYIFTEVGLYLSGSAGNMSEACMMLVSDTFRVELPDGIIRANDLLDLATLMYYLSQLSDEPDNSFFLGSRIAGRIINKSHTIVLSHIKFLRSFDMVELIQKSYYDTEEKQKMAPVYVFNGIQQ